MSPAEITNAKTFALKRGQLTTRIDPNYHALIEIPNSYFPLVCLGSLVRSEPSYGIASRAVARTDQNQPRYIRITDFGEDGIEDGHEFVTADPIDLDYELSAGDLLFARTGSVGKTYLHEDTSESAIFAGYCIRFRFDESKVDPRFVYWWTKTVSYSNWVKAIQRPAVQANINKEEFKNCPIPLPSMKEQKKLVSAMDNARNKQKAKHAEADSLLGGIDDFVLKTIGLGTPREESRRVFSISHSQLSYEHRLNSDYYHPQHISSLRRLDAISEHLWVTDLESIVSFERDQIKMPGGNYLGLAGVESHTGELTGSIDISSGTCFTYKTDDILFSRLRPYLNKVRLADMNGYCSTEFHVLRIKDKGRLLPGYLATILRSKLILAQTIHMMTGNTHPRLTDADVKHLKIPVPDLETQKIITIETLQRRSIACDLRINAEISWTNAILWFEGQLLKGAKA